MSPRRVTERRIVVRLLDGLGNQLFQYALGRRLAIDSGARLYFDAALFNASNVARQPHRFALPDFTISGDITYDDRWSGAWLGRGIADAMRWRLEQRLVPRHWRAFVQEDPSEYKSRQSTFDPKILKIRPNAYLFGWWISPRYFEGIEAELREELVLGDEHLELVRPRLQQIAECEAVSIHVRRGDFLKHPDFGVLGQDYYKRALQLISERVGNPRFFVFSDDVTAARSVLEAAGLSGFDSIELPPDTSPACDLWLMAACKHFINANSTFSWWGAWLSRNPSKIVVVPEHWYVGARIAVDDVYLDDWVKVAD